MKNGVRQDIYNMPTIPQRAGGLIPSPKDPRDLLLSAVSPSIIRIPKECPNPFDLDILFQNGYPHCVGYSCAAIKQEKELREKVSQIFDGDWIYKKCKEIDGFPNMQGTWFRIGLKVLQKYGAKPLNGLEDEASRYKIGTYALVDDMSFEGLKKAIFVNGALLGAFTGSNQGWQTAYIRPPKTGEVTWGHAITLVGYNENYLIGQNSWGNTWGDKGLFYIPKDYLPFEAWAILTDISSDIKEGWIALEFIRSIGLAEGARVTPITILNFRDKPGLVGKVIARLKPSDQLEIMKIGDKIDGYSWAKIKIIE